MSEMPSRKPSEYLASILFPSFLEYGVCIFLQRQLAVRNLRGRHLKLSRKLAELHYRSAQNLY
jgi:hypothetical protein